MTEKILKMIELSREESFGYELELRAEMGRFWCMLLKATEEVRSLSIPKNNTDVERVKLMMQYIHTHYGEKITLEDIAALPVSVQENVPDVFSIALITPQ